MFVMGTKDLFLISCCNQLRNTKDMHAFLSQERSTILKLIIYTSLKELLNKVNLQTIS